MDTPRCWGCLAPPRRSTARQWPPCGSCWRGSLSTAASSCPSACWWVGGWPATCPRWPWPPSPQRHLHSTNTGTAVGHPGVSNTRGYSPWTPQAMGMPLPGREPVATWPVPGAVPGSGNQVCSPRDHGVFGTRCAVPGSWGIRYQACSTGIIGHLRATNMYDSQVLAGVHTRLLLLIVRRRGLGCRGRLGLRWLSRRWLGLRWLGLRWLGRLSLGLGLFRGVLGCSGKAAQVRAAPSLPRENKRACVRTEGDPARWAYQGCRSRRPCRGPHRPAQP